MEPEHRLATGYAVAHPDLAARRLESADPISAASFLSSLDAEVAADVLSLMQPGLAALCMAEVDDHLGAEVLQLIPFQQCLLILRHTTSPARENLLGGLTSKRAAQIRRLLRYPAGTAGWMAETRLAPLPSEMTVAAARLIPNDLRFPYLYVVDRDHRLVGVVHTRDLQAGNDGLLLDAVAHTNPVRISGQMTVREVENHDAWRDFDALPVVDRAGVFIGVIRHKRLRNRDSRQTRPTQTTQPIGGFLDIAELYWSGLTDMISVLAVGESGFGESEHRDDQ